MDSTLDLDNLGLNSDNLNLDNLGQPWTTTWSTVDSTLDFGTQGKDTSDAWKEVKGKLSGEGELFSFIANKLKDTDLQHKVDSKP